MSDGPIKDRNDAPASGKQSLPEAIKWMGQLATERGPQLKLPQSGDPAMSRPNGPGWQNIPGWTPERENHPGGWPIQRFQDRPRPPLAPGVGPGTGPVDVPAPLVKPPATETDIRDSVYFNANGRSLLLSGALTGAAVNTSIWKLDCLTGAIAPEQRTGLARYWRDNLSPSQAALPGRLQDLQIASDRLRLRVSSLNIAEQVVRSSSDQRNSMAEFFRHQTPVGALSDVEQKFFQSRVDVIRDNAKFTRSNILAQVGTEAEVLARQKLFTHTEGQSLALQADQYWARLQSRNNALNCVKNAETVRSRAAAVVAQAERGSITTPGTTFAKGLGQGLGLAMLTVGADMALDKALGNDPLLKPYSSWGLQGVALPLLLVSRAGMPGKIIGSLGIVGASQLLDRAAGPPTGMFSTFARPNLPEVALITASALAPIKDWRVKTALVTCSWLAGRGYNLLNDRYEFEGKSQAKVQNEARTYVDLDKQERSEATFAEAVSRTTRFARQNEAAAAFLVADWQAANSSASMLEMQRGRGAMLTALGNVRLENGTRIDRSNLDRGDRVLAGKNYDLGGEAANYLRSAHTALSDAQSFARANRGRSINGRIISDAEIAQYDKLKSQAQKGLDTIYGEHDIDAVVSELSRRAQNQSADMKHFADNLKDYADKLTDVDLPYKGKIYRDLALLHLAFGAVAVDQGTKSEHYRNAAIYFHRAVPLDQRAPDLAKIQRRL